eukprot:scaffold22372_cov69-Phaeocystis_antarctica.AAC.4
MVHAATVWRQWAHAQPHDARHRPSRRRRSTACCPLPSCAVLPSAMRRRSSAEPSAAETAAAAAAVASVADAAAVVAAAWLCARLQRVPLSSALRCRTCCCHRARLQLGLRLGPERFRCLLLFVQLASRASRLLLGRAHPRAQLLVGALCLRGTLPQRRLGLEQGVPLRDALHARGLPLLQGNALCQRLRLVLARRRVSTQRGACEAPPPQRAGEPPPALLLDRVADQAAPGGALQRGDLPLRLVRAVDEGRLRLALRSELRCRGLEAGLRVLAAGVQGDALRLEALAASLQPIALGLHPIAAGYHLLVPSVQVVAASLQRLALGPPALGSFQRALSSFLPHQARRARVSYQGHQPGAHRAG